VDPLAFVPAYRAAAAAGLRRTGHQGENSPATAVEAVVNELGAERVDHGLSLAQDAALVQRFADRRVPLTMCPTSNVVIANAFRAVAEHPLPRLRAAGVLVTINTDDPALTDLDLAREYAACAQAWGWGFDQMVDLAVDGVSACWLDEADKHQERGRPAEPCARPFGGQLTLRRCIARLTATAGPRSRRGGSPAAPRLRACV
jgi:adenosine deaminase